MDESSTDPDRAEGNELRACLACTDLLTASRFVDEPGLSVRTLRSQGPADAAAAALPGVWLVDLSAFPNLPRVLRELHGEATWTIGFAPHVAEAVLEAGRQWCDVVVVRGAVVRSYGSLVREGAAELERRAGERPPRG
jgi:hypothetical protein